MRVGTGFDVHALMACGRLVLGGATIAFDRGVAGHSDPAYKDADSRVLLRRVWSNAA